MIYRLQQPSSTKVILSKAIEGNSNMKKSVFRKLDSIELLIKLSQLNALYLLFILILLFVNLGSKVVTIHTCE